jgi:hypothetical protein
MAAPLEYVRPELFDEAVDRHHHSYVTMATGTYPMGSAHPYPLGLNFTRRVTRECTRVGK